VSPTPRKYIVLNGNFVFDLHDFDLRNIIQECNPGIKRELPVLLTAYNVTLPICSKQRGICIQHIVHLNYFTSPENGDKLTVWQTWWLCLCLRHCV
jgi:hypothetical protein